jgi:hypothetical protein
MKLNIPEIIKRGYVFHDEYIDMGTNLRKVVLTSRSLVENIWICPLEEDTVNGKKFHFVFCEEPACFAGAPRGITGMVGIATSQGPALRGKATEQECKELFLKAGPAAIRYMRNLAKV